MREKSCGAPPRAPLKVLFVKSTLRIRKNFEKGYRKIREDLFFTDFLTYFADVTTMPDFWGKDGSRFVIASRRQAVPSG